MHFLTKETANKRTDDFRSGTCCAGNQQTIRKTEMGGTAISGEVTIRRLSSNKTVIS